MPLTATDRICAAIRDWSKTLDELPGWRDWNRLKVRMTLAVDDTWPGDEAPAIDHFEFPDMIGREHAVVMSYLALTTSLSSLRDCEYYFRRYPFRGLPMTHHDHLRYICEMYFGRFYEFSERMKVASRAIHALQPGRSDVFGALIKHFGKRFKSELKARNSATHDDRFEDIRIDNIAIISLVADDKERRPYMAHRARNSYRGVSHEWAERVRRRSKEVEEYLEAVATIILSQCVFLKNLAPPCSQN